MIMRKILLQLFILPLMSLVLQGKPADMDYDLQGGAQNDSVWFTYENTCFHDATTFHFFTTENLVAVRWMWHFGDLGISHVAEPQFFFDQPGDYTVTLTVYDEAGTPYEHSESVTIHPLPQPAIAGEETIVCRDARNVLFYTPFTAGHSYEWTLENETQPSTSNYVYLDFEDQAGLPKQVSLLLTETNEFGCMAQSEANILMTHFLAPPEGIVIRKTSSPASRLLLCLLENPDKFMFNWGYSTLTADSVMTTNFESGFISDNFYMYQVDINTVNHVYWVQIVDPEQNNCYTTSYLGNLTGDEMKSKKKLTGN
jgi:hypothetical protein